MSEGEMLDTEREALFGHGYDPGGQPEVPRRTLRALFLVRISDYFGILYILHHNITQQLCSRSGVVIVYTKLQQ